MVPPKDVCLIAYDPMAKLCGRRGGKMLKKNDGRTV